MPHILQEVYTDMFAIENLGKRSIPSPITSRYFTGEKTRILYNHHVPGYNEQSMKDGSPLSLECAGPRETIYYDPSQVHAAIVTCGGLCPGINDVIRAIVMALFFRYGVTKVTGFRYGFEGLIPDYGHEPLPLNPEVVKDIHTIGGSILASSRGHQDIGAMVDTLVARKINILFCVGGDGTMRAMEIIHRELKKRNEKIALIGVPKTIDNDLSLIDRSFGFDTAISEVVKVIQCGHVESRGAPNGIGLVKIMGRESGFTVAYATLAQNDVNVALIPEVPFNLSGTGGFLDHLDKRLSSRGHAVVLVAEGAGQHLCRNCDTVEKDASGNVRLFNIGVFLKDAIETYFRTKGTDINLKYIDPSYIIRSVPANASDSIYCDLLGQYAVHAGMAGKTAMVLGLYRGEYVHLPLKAVTSRRKLNPQSNLWLRVLEATGQPPFC